MMRVSGDLIEEGCSAKLHDNMDISHLMVHDQKVEDTRLKTSVVSRSGSPTKFVQLYLRLTRIGCLTLCPKSEEVEIHLVIRLLFPSVVRCIEMNAWWEWEIALVGEKMAIRLGIVLN